MKNNTMEKKRNVLQEMIVNLDERELEETRNDMILECYTVDKVNELLKDDIFKGKGYDCVTLSDAQDCYVEGYKDALERACDVIRELKPDCVEYLKERLIKDLDSQYM